MNEREGEVKVEFRESKDFRVVAAQVLNATPDYSNSVFTISTKAMLAPGHAVITAEVAIVFSSESLADLIQIATSQLEKMRETQRSLEGKSKVTSVVINRGEKAKAPEGYG